MRPDYRLFSSVITSRTLGKNPAKRAPCRKWRKTASLPVRRGKSQRGTLSAASSVPPPHPRGYPQLEEFDRFWAKLPPMNQGLSTLVALYKVFRWVALVVVVLLGIALLRRPTPVAPETTAETVQVRSQAFDAKLQQLADAHERGETSEARFSAEEVNAVIARTLEESAAPVTPAPVSSPAATQEPAAPEEATPGTPAGAPIRTVQVAFQGTEVTGQFATEMYGKEIYITLSGNLGSKNGYVTFEPTGVKVGDLVVPVSWLNEPLQEKLALPENREKLRLPDFIASMRVENGELVITEK
jgi:hypothetical protein